MISNSKNGKTIKVTLIKSLIGTKSNHRMIVKGLGLGKLNSHSILIETPSVKGMINKVNYLIKCEDHVSK